MTPYYDRAGIIIYHADCRDVLPRLEPGIALVVTDPPYGVGYSTGYRRNVARSSTRLRYDLATAPLLNDTVDAIAPLLNDTAATYWFAAPKRLDTVLPVLRGLGDVPNILCWDKGNCTAGDLYTTYGPQWEAIVYARRGKPRLIGGRDRDILRYSRGNTADYHHPTQKPVALLRYLIGRHDADLVLDPFAGGGSTLVAAREAGRRAVGVEIEERYCEIAATRLDALLDAEAA